MENYNFWKMALAWQGSATPRVAGRVLVFGAVASLFTALSKLHVNFVLNIGPFEVWGAVIGILLVLRTNAGHDRWWEARKLWGGIVNQTRNMAIAATAYGPQTEKWQKSFLAWSAVFCHVVRCGLRNSRQLPELEKLIGAEETSAVANAEHMAVYVSRKLANLLQEACSVHQMSHFYFLQIDKERAQLIDHMGACERILKTPIPLVYSIKIGRFLLLYLLLLPLALINEMGWYTPLATMLVAYPFLSLDQIGVELQNPFCKDNLSHLPLDQICGNLEKNVLALRAQVESMEKR